MQGTLQHRGNGGICITEYLAAHVCPRALICLILHQQPVSCQNHAWHLEVTCIAQAHTYIICTLFSS